MREERARKGKRRRQKRRESEKWAPLFRSKWMKGKRKMQFQGYFSVGHRAGQRALDTDESKDKHRGRLERSNQEHNLGRALEGIDVWWIYWVGNAALSRESIQLSKWAERPRHRWEGHKARFSEDHWLAKSLRTRSVQR